MARSWNGKRIIARVICICALLTGSTVVDAKVPITMWLSSQPQSVVSWVPEFEEAFNKANPDIELKVETYQWVSVQREKLIVNAAAGTAPDIFFDSSNVMGMWVENGLAKPLDSFIAKWRDRDDLIAGPLADLRFFGKTYGVPTSIQPFWDVYNMGIYDQAGATLPNTWDQMVGLAKKLTKVAGDGKVETFGYSVTSLNGVNTFLDFERTMEQQGTRSINPDTSEITINTDAGRKALEYLSNLVHAGMPNMQVGSFNKGNVATMHWGSTRELNDTLKALGGPDKVTLALRRYVGPKPGTDLTHYLSGVFFILSTSKYPQEAWRVLEAWMSTQNLKGYLSAYATNLPARKSMLGIRELRTGPYADQMFKAMEGPIIAYGSRHFQSTNFRTPVGDVLAQAIKDQIAIPAALEQAETTLRQVIADAKKK